MRDSIALVYPFHREESPAEEEKLFPPLSIAYLAGQMKERSLHVSVHDGTFLTPEDLVRNVAGDDPGIVSMYIMITLCRHAASHLRELRELLPDALFIAGGPLPTLYPERFAVDFDVVFCGEGDLTVPRFCDDYCRSGCVPVGLSTLDLTSYPGICTGHGDSIVRVPPVHHPVETIDRLPLPDRSLFDHRRYREFWRRREGHAMTSIMITRGCPFSCDFCSKPVWGNEYRKPSLDRVFAEIDDILSYGYDRIWIADDSFTLDSGYLVAFCERKIDEDLPFTWTCLSRVNGLDAHTVRTMRDAGCVRVYLGLESGDDDTLRLMGKKVTVAEGIRAVGLFRDKGIETAGFFMVGYPGETEESIAETLRLAVDLPLDDISINVPYPLPGSPLFSRVACIDPAADWETANEVSFLYTSEFDEQALRGKILEAREAFRKKRRAMREDQSLL